MSPTKSRAQRKVAPEIEFLEDWRDDHRSLAEPQRAKAGRYIAAIVGRDVFATDDLLVAQALSIQLWVRFRELYDDLRGPFARSDAEDFARAMGAL